MVSQRFNLLNPLRQDADNWYGVRSKYVELLMNCIHFTFQFLMIPFENLKAENTSSIVGPTANVWDILTSAVVNTEATPLHEHVVQFV